MKSIGFNVKDKLVARYLNKDTQNHSTKSTNINVLLNRVKTNQKNESRKKLYFSAAASAGLFLFGLIIF
jgi:hypothetical protein|tara:strand:- start:46 stop:252 length:207 start_codon:yes stop_codon:yes gene_type:complete